MPMEKAVVNWIKTSDYDIATAKALFKAKRYVYVIFLCHLSVEKLLKAVVCKLSKKIPPKTHDLLLLLRLANLTLPRDFQMLIARLNAVSIPTRYPEDVAKLTKQYNSKAGKEYLEETGRFLKWLKQNSFAR